MIQKKAFPKKALLFFAASMFSACLDQKNTEVIGPANETLQAPQGLEKVATTHNYVGVIPRDNDCIDSWAKTWFFMDDEDNGNASTVSWSASYITPWGAVDSFAHDTKIKFCQVEGGEFKNLSHTASTTVGSNDYVVLSLDTNCPTGSYSFSKRIDNEDNSNSNSNSQNITPSTQGVDTEMRFCFFPEVASSGQAMLPPRYNIGAVGNQYYAVFAKPQVDGTAWKAGDRGYILSDDEDSGNSNLIFYFGAGWTTDFQNRAKAIIAGGGDTKFYTAVAAQN